ncbi:MAG: insulinase family protein [Pseudomonadota bacterium]
MFHQRFFAGRLSVLFCIVFLFACSPRHPIVVPDGGALIDPAIVYGVLPNGFQYVLKKNTIPEKRISLHLEVFSGSMNETDSQQGIAHYLEHMVFNGSTHFKPGELVDYFHSIGMDFGGDANAHTGFFNTVYDLDLPGSDVKQLDKAFLIFQDYAAGALLLESEIDRERGIILAEKRERDSVSSRIFKKTLAFELDGSLITNRFPIGIESVINAADRKLLKAYYDQWYRPDNMALVVVGDINLKMTEQMIVQRFSQLESRSLPPSASPSVEWKAHQGNKAFYYHDPEASTTDISIQTISYVPVKPQTISMLKQQALDQIANQMVQNRISRLINHQKASFTEASVYSGSYYQYIKASGISATCQPEQWTKTLEQIEQILRQALDYGYSQRELDRVKSDYITSLEQADTLSASRKNNAISKSILSRINTKQLLISERQRLYLLKPYIESITIDQAHEAFKAAWGKNHRLITVTGSVQIDPKTAEDKILGLFQKSFSHPITPYQEFESRSFPYLNIPEVKGKIRSKDDRGSDLGIQIIEFENNVRLNLKQTDFKPNEFSIKACFGEGKRSVPVSKPGIAILAGSVLTESGFGQIDKDQLEEALAGKKVRTAISIDNNYIAISGSGNPDDAATVFELIVHHIKDPGFKQSALDLVKTLYKQEYDGLVRTPDGLMQIKGAQFLANDDPRFGMPLPQIIDHYTIKDIQDWLNPAFEQAPLEVSIVGDFDSDKMIELTQTYLGSLKTRKPFPLIPTEPGKIGFPKGKKLELALDTQIDNAVVHVAFLTDDFWDIQQTRQLSVLSKIFSERLRLIIREELGESYSPYVFNNASTIYKDYGVLQAVVSVKPENHLIVTQKIKQIVESFSFNGISDQETQYAINPLLTYLKSYRQTNDYWLNSVLSDSSNFPVKFDWARNIVTGYENITRDELMALANKYLQIKDSALIVILPGKGKIKE